MEIEKIGITSKRSYKLEVGDSVMLLDKNGRCIGFIHGTYNHITEASFIFWTDDSISVDVLLDNHYICNYINVWTYKCDIKEKEARDNEGK